MSRDPYCMCPSCLGTQVVDTPCYAHRITPSDFGASKPVVILRHIAPARSIGTDFVKVAVCTECSTAEDWHANSSLVPCRHCGVYRDRKMDVAGRWVSTSLWWKPTTWCSGFWELAK